MAKRKKTETIHLRVDAEIKAKIASIAHHTNRTITEVLEAIINKEAEGLPLNLQLKIDL